MRVSKEKTNSYELALTTVQDATFCKSVLGQISVAADPERCFCHYLRCIVLANNAEHKPVVRCTGWGHEEQQMLTVVERLHKDSCSCLLPIC